MDRLSHLALAAAGGDRDALERFVAETQADVWRLCRYLGGADVADDLAQETYERALTSMHRYRGAGSARGWLLTIARRVCADHIRRTVRRRRRDRAVFDDAVAGGSGAIPSLAEVGAEGRVELGSLIERLGEDRRAAFVLTQDLGLSYEEAATILDCPIGTIRSRVARARADLLAMLEPDRRGVPGGAEPSGDVGPMAAGDVGPMAARSLGSDPSGEGHSGTGSVSGTGPRR